MSNVENILKQVEYFEEKPSSVHKDKFVKLETQDKQMKTLVNVSCLFYISYKLIFVINYFFLFDLIILQWLKS